MKLIIRMLSLLVASLVFGVSTASLYSDNHDSQDQLLVAAIEFGELLVTRSVKDCSAALITQISPNESLAIGDRATIKVQIF